MKTKKEMKSNQTDLAVEEKKKVHTEVHLCEPTDVCILLEFMHV